LKIRNRYEIINKLQKLVFAMILIFATYESVYPQVSRIVSTKNTLRYNRVEGWHIGAKYNLFNLKDGKIRTELSTGYGITSNIGTYSIGMKYQVPSSIGVEGGVFYFRDVGTNDLNIMGRTENSLATLFAKEDFLNYYIGRGIVSNVIYRRSRKHEISGSFHIINYKNIRSHDVFSFSDIISIDKSFSANPVVLVGEERKLLFGYTYDSRINQFMLTDNFVVSVEIEKSGDQFGGDFEYNGYRIGIKKYKRTFGPQMLVIRGLLGVRDRNVGEQFLYDLGGIGTLRGYGHKEFTGNRVGMINIDYLFNRALIKKLPLRSLPFYTTMSLIAFFDAGWTNLGKSPLNRSSSFDISDIKSNIGIGYSFGRDLVRINLAKRLDGGDGFKITIRLLQRL